MEYDHTDQDSRSQTNQSIIDISEENQHVARSISNRRSNDSTDHLIIIEQDVEASNASPLLSSDSATYSPESVCSSSDTFVIKEPCTSDPDKEVLFSDQSSQPLYPLHSEKSSTWKNIMSTILTCRVLLPALLSLAGMATFIYGTTLPDELVITSVGHKYKDTLENYTYCQAGFPEPTSYQPPVADAELIHLQAIIRHGDRSPFTVIMPNEPVNWRCDDMYEIAQVVGAPVNGPNIGAYVTRIKIPENKAYTKFWSNGTCTLGQLTSKGAQQHLELGARLRNIYVDQLKFLPDRLSASDLDGQTVYLRSTDTWRTKQSAAALLSGMWPPSTARANDAQVFPIDVYPREIETMLGHKDSCPRLNRVLDGLRQTPAYNQHLNDHAALRKHLEELLDTKNKAEFSRTWVPYMDAIQPRVCHNMPLPCRNDKCITVEDANELSISVNQEYTLLRGAQTDSLEFNRLTLGYFLGELRDRMLIVTESDQKAPRFELFSGHDDTVYGLIGLLLADDLRWPPYASNLIFELWKNSPEAQAATQEEYLVRVLYNGKPLETNWCDLNACPLSTYLKHIENLIVRDMQEICY